MTAAINIAHDKSEREIDRELKAHSPSHNTYFDLVTLEGILQLRNYETRDVQIQIVNGVPGEPIEADGTVKMSLDPTKLRLLERTGSITWTVALKPQEEKTLKYIYKRYVKSN